MGVVAASITPVGWLWFYVSTKFNFPSVRASLARRFPGFILFVKKGHLLGTMAQRLQDLNANKAPASPALGLWVGNLAGQTADAVFFSCPLQSAVTCAPRISEQLPHGNVPLHCPPAGKRHPQTQRISKACQGRATDMLCGIGQALLFLLPRTGLHCASVSSSVSEGGN